MKLKTTLLWLIIVTNTFAQTVEIPDPNLREAIREALELPADAPITQQQMLTLENLNAGGNRDITDLTGLEYAINLKSLGLYQNPITDISVFSHLINLQGFNLWGCQIKDISPLKNLTNLRSIVLGNNQISDLKPLVELINLTFIELESNQISDVSPLSGLINLTALQLDDNQITDFRPLANLINLEQLWIQGNFGTDISPLVHLNLTDFRYDELCILPPYIPSVTERIENRSFPSVVQAWDDVIGLNHLTWQQQNALHDLHFSPRFERSIRWHLNSTEPTIGLATQLEGDLRHAEAIRQQLLDHNPNMVFLIDIRIHNHLRNDDFPPILIFG